MGSIALNEAANPIAKPVDDIKRHVVQLEVLVLFVVLLQGVLLIEPLLVALLKGIAFLLPFMLLALVPTLVRVTNPESTLRSRLAFGLSGAGFGGSIGGAIAGLLSLGAGTPGGRSCWRPYRFCLGCHRWTLY